MGKLSGLNEGDAMTADVSEDRADVGVVLALLVGPDEVDATVVADVRPPPDCKMLKAAGKAGEMADDDVGGKSVGGPPRVAVRSSGEIDGCCW